MKRVRASSLVPDPTWGVPSPTWSVVLDRYTRLLQVPTWRASVRAGGKEKDSCLSADQAELLRTQMLEVLARLPGQRATAKASIEDLEELSRRCGRATPRSERCPSKLQTHFQRAFLLDAAGYRCPYCQRTAWGVYGEKCKSEAPRTLRFEVDHRTTRQRLKDRNRFDPKNLVTACRSCNVIKAEMTVDRFLFELGSLSRSVQRPRGESGPTQHQR
jgi:5-methylcytosine-specific restriction endonuclease McrA